MFNQITNNISLLKSEIDYKLSRWHHVHKLPQLSVSDRQIVDTLKRKGAYITSLAELGFDSTPKMITSAYRYLESMTKPREIHGSYNLPEIYTMTDLPEFFNWGIETRLHNIIENYIGLPIAFHGVHLRKDFPNPQQAETLLWHKDSEDRRMIKVIIYLHDVTKEHGPFEYIPIPQNLEQSWQDSLINKKLKESKFLGINDQQVEKIIPRSHWKSCTGNAGTVLIADTRTTLHHGTIRSKARSALFFAYTANPPKRPELCTQYHDNTFIKPYQELQSF
jgi:hypothetical protein